MNMIFHAESGEKVYRFMSSGFNDTIDGVVQCQFEIDSMYFDKPETLTLKLWGYEDYENAIEIPLVLER
jgi:hypothetical protein